MRPLSLLAPLAAGLLLGVAAPAGAGTYDVAWDGHELNGRFGGVSQVGAGSYRAVDTATGARIEIPPGSAIAPGGFAARSIAAPGGSQFVAVTAITEVCTAAPGLYGALASPAPVLTLTHHAHASPTCSTRSGTLAIGQPHASVFLGTTAPGGSGPAYDTSHIEVRSLHATVADDVAPSHLAAASPSSGAIVGVPEVELHWAGHDAGSGIATVQVEQDSVPGAEIGGLPAPDRARGTGQRTKGEAWAGGGAIVPLAGPGRHSLRVRVTDGAGNAATSGSFAVTYVAPPRSLAAPRITGTALPGSTLACDPGTWAADPAPTLRLAWRRNGTPIDGATADAYVPGAADVGATLDCRVTASNAGTAAGGAPTVVTSSGVMVAAPAAPSASVDPSVRGTARSGETLTCDVGRWDDPQPRLGIAWRRDGAGIAGATGAAFVPQPADVGHELDCVVVAIAPGVAGATTMRASAAVRVLAAPGASLMAAASIDGRPLDPSRPATLPSGAVVRVEGELVDGAGPAGRTVVARVAHPGAETRSWSIPVNPHGRFSALLRPERGGVLTLRYEGDARSGPAERLLAQLRLQHRIQARFTARRAAGGMHRALAVTGRVAPAPGVALRLGWQARPRAGRAWQAFCRHGDGIVVRPDGTFSGRCRLPLRLYRTNRYRVVLTPAPLAPYVASQSPAAAAHLR